VVPNHYLTEKYLKVHDWECQRRSEQARLAASGRQRRNVARYAVSKLGTLLMKLGNWMRQLERVGQSPRPVTGNL
jgi:hypothetical protein